MVTIDNRLLDDLVQQARGADRLRRNFNFHAAADEPSQRMLNAIEPGSYIRPHRHLDPPKSEAFLALRGTLAVIVFASDGRIEEVRCISPRSSCLGVELAPGQWHTVVALEPGTVCYETKPGPYLPLSENDFAPWAPAEGTAEAATCLARLTAQVKAWSVSGQGG